MNYRKEIDGLRAIAILPVIFFHAGIFGFSGGYVGVDIFFVISGYLITSIILEEYKNKKFSILNFYERRARRILPALSFVLFCSTVMAYLLMPAKTLTEYSQSLVSVCVFSSNIFFYLTSGYFSQESSDIPLLHTWSLAVEEQYYIFFPLLIAALIPFGKKILVTVILVLAVISLLFSEYLSINFYVSENFYLIFSRAWELFLGSIIAFVPLQQLNTKAWFIKDLIAVAGLLMIAYSIFFYNGATPFPSFYALVPVLGACFIIVFANAKSLVGRFLSNKILVTIGLMSYSLYLWHQPFLAFLHLKSITKTPLYFLIIAIICTFVFSYFSWQFIEKPFRDKNKFNRKLVFKYSACVLSFFTVIGLLGHFYKGFENRFNVASYADSTKGSPKRKECHTSGANYLKPNEACKFFGNNLTWASFGDSHSVEIAYALAQKLKDRDEGLVQLSFSGCPPSLMFEVKLPGCSKWIKESIAYLEQTESIKHVFVGFRHSKHLYGSQVNFYPDFPDENPADQFTNFTSKLNASEARELYWKSFEAIISRLINAGKHVYVLYPIPELPNHINKIITPFWIWDKSPSYDLTKTTPVSYFLKRNDFLLTKLDNLPYSNRLHAIKPFEEICDDAFCSAVKDNTALYFDDNHLSVSGASFIIKNINLIP